MADEIARPKITLTLDKEQAEAAIKALKSIGSDTGAALEKSLGAALDNSTKRIRKLADEISGGGATKKLQELEKVVTELGKQGNLSSTSITNLATRIKTLQSQGGTATPALQGILGQFDALKSQGAGVGSVLNSIGGALKSEVTAGASSAVGSIGQVGTALAKLGPYGIAAAAAIALTVGGFVALGNAAKTAIEFASTVSDLSLKTGTSAVELQKMGAAGAMVGVSMESASGGITKFQKALEDSPEKIEALGLNIAQLKAMDPGAAFALFAEKIGSISSPSERTAAAMSVLGRSAAELMPLLRTLGEGAGDTAERLGAVLSDDVVKGLDEVDDAAAMLGKVWEGMWLQLGASVASAVDLKGVLTSLAEAVGVVANAVKTYGPTIASGLGTIFKAYSTFAVNPLLGRMLPSGDKAFQNYETKGTRQQALDLEEANFVGPQDPRPKRKEFAGDIEDIEQSLTEAEVKELKIRRDARTAFAEDEKKLQRETLMTQASAKGGLEATIATQRLSTQFKIEDIRATEGMNDAEKNRLVALTAVSGKQKELLEIQKAGAAAAKQFAQEEAKRIAFQEKGGPQLAIPDHLELAKDILARASKGAGPGFLGGAPGLILPPNYHRDLELANKLAERNASAAIDWDQALQNIANSASFLPGVFGDVLGSIASAGSAIKSFDFKKAVATEGGGIKDIFSLTGGGGIPGLLKNAMPAMQLAGLGLDIGKKIFDALHQTETEKIMKDIGRDFGVQISEGLAKQIEKDAKGGVGRGDAALKNLGAVIGEGGGVKAFGVEKTMTKMHDLFSAMERGTLSAKEVGSVFDDVFGDVIPLAIDKTTGRLNDQARELLRLAQTRGVKSEQITALVASQGSAALAGLTTFMKSAEITTQGSATAIAGSIATIFDDMLASGMGRGEAIAAITPAVQALREELTATGFAGTEAFAGLDAQIALMGSEKFGPMIDGITGLGTAITSMHNLNILTQADFTALSGQVTETFNAMVLEGADANAAMSALSPTLQTIWELQQDYGLAVDDSTQGLLDQAVAAGAVGDAHRSAEDRMVESMDRLGSIFELVAEKLGVTRAQLDALPTNKKIDVQLNVTRTGETGVLDQPGGYGDTGEGIPAYAGGSGGIRNYGGGTLALLHGAEGVFTNSQLNNIVRGAQRAGAASAGSIPGGVSSSESYGADMLASMDTQIRLLSQLPAVLARTTRDAVVFGKVTVPRS